MKQSERVCYNTISGKLIRKLNLDCEFAKSTMLLNRLLRKIRLHICKDCQKLSSAKKLRCKRCDLDHTEYLYEKIASDLQYEEQDDYDEDEEPNWSDRD